MGDEKTCDKEAAFCPGVCLPRKRESDDGESIETPWNVCQQNFVRILKKRARYFQHVVHFDWESVD
jgi:hypothetical protein